MKQTLGLYLKRIRKEQNLTLRAVQERTGISNAYLSQLENDKIAHPSPKILYKLAKCYRISYEHLMELAGYPLPVRPKIEAKKLEPAFRLSTSFEDLTDEEKKRVLEFIEFLRSRRAMKK